ncbi:MAG: hypothetical protein G8D58_09730 [gamma proteobacterium symbiont of Phacoides pectinatus]
MCRYLVKDFGTSQSPKSTRQRDSRYRPDRPALINDSVPYIAAKLLVRTSVMLTTMTLRPVGCANCMPYVTPYRS